MKYKRFFLMIIGLLCVKIASAAFECVIPNEVNCLVNTAGSIEIKVLAGASYTYDINIELSGDQELMDFIRIDNTILNDHIDDPNAWETVTINYFFLNPLSKDLTLTFKHGGFFVQTSTIKFNVSSN